MVFSFAQWEHKTVFSARVPLNAIVGSTCFQIIIEFIYHLCRCPFIGLSTSDIHFTLNLVRVQMRRIFGIDAKAYTVKRRGGFNPVGELGGNREGEGPAHTISGTSNRTITCGIFLCGKVQQ